MAFKCISNIYKKWRSLLVRKDDSKLATNMKKDTDIKDIYHKHEQMKFKPSYYTLTAMTPNYMYNDEASSPVMNEFSPFTSSPSLISKYLDNCEAERSANEAIPMTPITSYPGLISKYFANLEADQVIGTKSLTTHNIHDTTVGETRTTQSPFISSPNTVGRLFDECEAQMDYDRVKDGLLNCSYLLKDDMQMPKLLPKRTVLFRGRRF